jgi:hypothetical protein
MGWFLGIFWSKVILEFFCVNSMKVPKNLFFLVHQQQRPKPLLFKCQQRLNDLTQLSQQNVFNPTNNRRQRIPRKTSSLDFDQNKLEISMKITILLFICEEK